MKQIRITRDAGGNVSFETVSVDTSTLTPSKRHFPDIAANQLGPAPSAPSSQSFPKPSYGCHLHSNEQGRINIFPPLAKDKTTLSQAINGQPIAQ